MKALLLRVGIDKGTDGALAPIFKDGSFEYIPISETDEYTDEVRTYSNLKSRSGKPLSYYLPERLADRKVHFDPEFETCTYGDPTSKRDYLLKLQRGDLLTFYVGLTPYNNDVYDEALYVIGYFTIDAVNDFNKMSESEMQEAYRRYSNNAHIKRVGDFNDLVLIKGNMSSSRLLDRAVLISERATDKNGRSYHRVSSSMQKLLGISGSIQRSIPPRTITENYIANLMTILSYKD